MASYTYETGTSSTRFPATIMTKHGFKDVDNNIAPYINKIKEYEANGDYVGAANYLKGVSAAGVDLTKYILSMEYLNFLDEETRNVEIYTKAKKQQIFYTTYEPSSTELQDVWITDGGVL